MPRRGARPNCSEVAIGARNLSIGCRAWSRLLAIRRMRCALTQARIEPSNRSHVARSYSLNPAHVGTTLMLLIARRDDGPTTRFVHQETFVKVQRIAWLCLSALA